MGTNRKEESTIEAHGDRSEDAPVREDGLEMGGVLTRSPEATGVTYEPPRLSRVGSLRDLLGKSGLAVDPLGGTQIG